MEFDEQRKELKQIRDQAAAALTRLALVEKQIKDSEKHLAVVADSVADNLSQAVEKAAFIDFFKRPYVVIPMTKNRVLVAVPKFIKNFQVGWLWKEDQSFYIYQLDQYSAWLGDIPHELLDEINFKQGVQAYVQGNQVLFEPSQRDKVRQTLGKHVADITENTARIIKGHEFEILADMIKAGCLPFKPLPVAVADMRASASTFTLRPYQEPAFKKFLETGAIGLFHPTGAGKSMIAMKAMDRLQGKKIVFVPTRTLAEQWNYYITTHIPTRASEIEIATYQGFRRFDDEFALAIFDEVHKLPADTFSRLAVVKTKYRIGLSASPFREDGRESYIFALTGFPIGLNWQEYMQTVGKSYHPIYVHVVTRPQSQYKLAKVKSLVDLKKRTLIFSDSLELGKQISQSLGVPFISGDTSNRLDVLNSSRVVVVSRVMDLGVSIKDLQHIIEVDFLFGSRQQELQRTGRLMHSEATDTRHDIIMTEQELQQYGKRLWSLQEKGFQIKVVE